jgi:hypothetical protein
VSDLQAQGSGRAAVSGDVPETWVRRLDAYFDAYDKRRAARADGRVFDAVDLDALVGLAITRATAGMRDDAQLRMAVALLDDATRGTLESRERHHVGIDIAGLAWAEAYGVLALPDPPHEQLEWVLERGRGSGSVRGLVAVGWRTLFLATATPLLNWRWRRVAQTELDRRRMYVREKLDALLGAPGDRAPTSADIRLAVILLEFSMVGGAPPGRREMAYARRTVEARDQQLPTSQLCQMTLLLRAAVDPRRGAELLGRAIAERSDAASGLLRARPAADAGLDLSPWVPLALAAHGAVPSRWRGS